jgi:hypothetical protein
MIVGDEEWAATVCRVHSPLTHVECGCGMPNVGEFRPGYQSGPSVAMEQMRKERNEAIAEAGRLRAAIEAHRDAMIRHGRRRDYWPDRALHLVLEEAKK